MSETEINSRGSAIRWRTLRVGGKTIRVAVVRRAGTRGGRTVAGPPHETTGKGDRGDKE